MSPLIRKEIRLILPFWGIALALAIFPACFLVKGPFLWVIDETVLWLFAFGLLLLGLAPFGQEFGLGTFSAMLAQPFERRRIWRTKFLLVTVAAAIVFAGFIATLHMRVDANFSQGARRIAESQANPGNQETGRLVAAQKESEKHLAEAFSNAVETGLLLLAVAITGGLWTTLLFRQTGAALWFAILIPGVLVVIVEAVFQYSHAVLATVLILYSIAGLIWAQLMFLSAQDSQWLGETVALLSFSSNNQKTDTAASRRKGAFRALVRKEFQSHQISLLVAFGLLVLHLCTLVFRRFETLPKNSDLRSVVDAMPFLWLLIPGLIGSVTVAEERKLGTMESQLCLPVTRRFQFFIKFAVALLLGFGLGCVAPVLLETIGGWFHISSNIIELSLTASYHGIVAMGCGALLIAIVSFFSSTLCRNTLHAMGGAVVWGCAFFFLGGWIISNSSHFYDYALWKGPLIFFIGVPVILLTVIGLSFSNYKRLHAGRNVWLRNLLILAVALFFTGISTAFIYQRPWELAMSLEPHHGATRLSGPIEPMVCVAGGRIFALLPDGRLWTGADYRAKEFNQLVEMWDSVDGSNRLQNLRLSFPTTGIFLGGSNWVAVAGNQSSIDVVAMQADGTLWNVISRSDRTNRAAWLAQAPQPRRIGADNDWKSVATGERYFLAVKNDGTLWGWGNNEDHRFPPQSYERMLGPMRIGSDSDWAMVFSRYSDPLLMKTDGTIFKWRKVDREERYEMRKANLNGKDWVAVAGSPERDVVVRRDGTLWGRGYLPEMLFGSHNPSRAGRREVFTRIGHRSDWAQIAGDYSSLVALRKDGSLVKNETELFSATLGQPSRYSDWLAVDSSGTGITALASDGTLSLWRDTRSQEGFALAASRRPVWDLNIFSSGNP